MVNSHDLFVEHVYPHPKKHPCMIYSYLHLVFFWHLIIFFSLVNIPCFFPVDRILDTLHSLDSTSSEVQLCY